MPTKPGPTIRDAVDDAVDLVADDWEPVMSPAVQPVIDAIMQADSLEDARNRLLAFSYNGKIDVAPLIRKLTQLQFSGHISAAAVDEPSEDGRGEG